ncbi:MAG: hypothetical protein Q9224_005361, partial [Gallowayella concinna]
IMISWATSLQSPSILLLFVLTLFPSFATAEPPCENSPHPLPALHSCSKLISTIHRYASSDPYLYHWSRHPGTEVHSRSLPRSWIDPERHGLSPYTYFCIITVDVIEGHEEDGADSFGFNQIAVAANEIVWTCLKRERGLRPQVGWEGLGLLRQPKVISVRVGSVRGVNILRMSGNRTMGLAEKEAFDVIGTG